MNKHESWSPQIGDALSSDFDRMSEQELMAYEAKYCSWGDTVHYMDTLKIYSLDLQAHYQKNLEHLI